MNLKFILLVCLALFSHKLFSALVCPPDKYLTCHDDIHHIPTVGEPTVFGGSGQLRYFDQSNNNACNVGHIVRTWYLDSNSNQSYDQGEHACIQNIHVSYTSGSVTIDWPADLLLNCKDAIPTTNPTWVSGPCDIIGVSKYDQVFGTDTKNCYKILRNFTVINWCVHVPGTNIGKWTHTQVIKIDDPSRPVIKNCDLVTIGTDVGCQANFSVSNSATDISVCGQQRLLWKAEVDLWADGSIEYTFVHNHPDTLFRLDTVTSGQNVTIKLPFPVMRGYHKVTWSVHDPCGNAAKCEQKVFVKDTKKPTPYLHDILSSAFEGKDHPLKIPARIFNVGSFDNCTKPHQLRFSFSPNVNDTIRTVNCNNAGFQFYTIYVTDHEGNQERVDVFMLVFDNGACSNTLRLSGTVSEGDNIPLSDVGFKLQRKDDVLMEISTISDQNGIFTWENISLYKDMEIIPSYTKNEDYRVDISDFKMLQDYLMGKKALIDRQYLAADLDADQKIRIKDLQILKDRILKPEAFNGQRWKIAAGIDSIHKESDLNNVKTQLFLSETNGNLDFKAVYLGDISDANNPNSAPRTKLTLIENVKDNVINYTINESLSLYGLQVFLKVPAELTGVQVTSTYFDIAPQNLSITEFGELRFIVTKDITLKEGDILFSLQADELISEETPVLHNGSKMLLAEYRTSDLKLLKNMPDELSIHPNPTSSGFTIYGNNYELHDIKTVSGQSVPFIQNNDAVEWNVDPGIYIVYFRSGGKTFSKKIIKI